jgi:ABC-type nitrate/sulfonate/bicarbonate transport system substrate-binding protein
MNRRDFLKQSTVLTGATGLGISTAPAFAQASPEIIRVGHLVGICMSPLFYADAMGYFKDEKLNVELKFMPNPGDAMTALTSGSLGMVHVPFTNLTVAAQNGAPVRIIAGSGAGGIFLIAQSATGIKNITDLQKAKGKGLKIGTMRVTTFELTTYRLLQNAGLKYDDFQMVWFNDVVSLAAAFEAKALDLVTHVEPFATNLVDKMGGVPIGSNLDVWGKDGPDCVTSTRADFLEKNPDAVRRYIKALLRADREIKASPAKAIEAMDKGKYYRVNKEVLTASLPRQMPQVDLTRGGDKGMEIAINDMIALGYLKRNPEGLMDFRLLREAIKG